uniref:Uncharacterized protein n=1 Tax=Arundo donax TaxID=35708 RepID=A0A0A9CMW8_ARUDO
MHARVCSCRNDRLLEIDSDAPPPS